MDEIQQQVTQLVQAAMQGNQEATQQIQQIMQAAQQGNQLAILIAQIIQQVAQLMQQLQVQAAKFGAKLNYIRQLRGQCPDGYEMKYFKNGGLLCKKCIKKQSEPNTVSGQFKMQSAKYGNKMKKKLMESEKFGSKIKKKSCK